MSDDLTEQVDAELAALHGDPERLRRYDINGNRQLDDDEWALVRRMVETELRTRARQRTASPTAVGEPFRVGEYEVIGVLGSGGQGVTYLATDADGERVALKKLHLGQVNEWKAVELFDREAEALKRLDHPCIPSFVDAFHIEHDDGIAFYLAQEFVFGEDLEQVLERDGRLEEEAVIALVEEVAGILEYLHDQKPSVVHRDIKPSNLIRHNDGRLVLVDFGAAQIARSTVGGSTVVGTSGYMPMEQYVGNAAPASDLYALGATAVHLLSGTPPMDLPTVRMRLEFEDVVNASQRTLDLLRNLLEPHVEDRPQDAEELRALLQGWDRSTALENSPAFEMELAAKKWVAIRDDQVEWLRERVDGSERVITVATHRQDAGWSFDKFTAIVQVNTDTTKMSIPVSGTTGAIIMVGGFVVVLALFWAIKNLLLAAIAANVFFFVGVMVVVFAWFFANSMPRRTVLIGDGRVQVFGMGSDPLFDEQLDVVLANDGRLSASGRTIDVCGNFEGGQGDYLKHALKEELHRVQGLEDSS